MSKPKFYGLQIWQFFLLLFCLPMLGSLFPAQAAGIIVIEYWQPALNNNEARVNGIEQLITEFETLHPEIDVVHNYKLSSLAADNQYEPSVGYALREGAGPDVVTLFNGWLPAWVNAGYLIPLPQEYYSESYIQQTFYPIVETSRYEGQFWALPTAVRSMALFYNKDLFDTAGLAYPTEAWTWNDFAVSVSVLNGVSPDSVGFDWEVRGWGHHWLREVLVPQFGGSSYVANPVDSIWGSAAACEAFTWALSLEAAPRDTETERSNGVGRYFELGHSAMHVDGSFRLETIADRAPELNYGVVPLPTMSGDRGVVARTFGSYWTHGLTPHANGDKARFEASIAFLNYITSAQAGLVWSGLTGELPAQRAAEERAITGNPLLEPFLRSLDYAYATPFVNETTQFNYLAAAYDSVRLQGADPCDALRHVHLQEQELIDDFVENRQRWELGAELIPLGSR